MKKRLLGSSGWAVALLLVPFALGVSLALLLPIMHHIKNWFR